MNEAVSPALEGVSISASAARRLNKCSKGEAGAALRISVKGGGCSGFQYAFDVERTRADDDFVVTRDGATLIVDPVSLEMLKGAELDFVDDLMGQAFGSRTRTRSPRAAAGSASRSSRLLKSRCVSARRVGAKFFAWIWFISGRHPRSWLNVLSFFKPPDTLRRLEPKLGQAHEL